MLPKLLTSIFGSRNDRLLKQYRHGVVKRSTRSKPTFEKLSDAELRAKTAEFRAARRRRRDARRAPARGLRRRARGVQARAGHAPLRRAADRRHRAAQRQDRRDAHRRGQDAGGHAAVYLNALAGKGVHVVTVNDYLARRDAEWMGRLYRFLGLTVGVNVPQMERGEAGGLRAPTSPTAPTTSSASTTCATTWRTRSAERFQRGLELRDRRRGRLDPDRRGAHAAHHLRPGRGPHRALRAHQRRRPEAEEADRRARPAHRRRRDRAGRLHGRREEAPGHRSPKPATSTPRSSCATRACCPRARASTTRRTSC